MCVMQHKWIQMKYNEGDYASGLSYTPETRQREKKINFIIQNQVNKVQ